MEPSRAGKRGQNVGWWLATVIATLALGEVGYRTFMATAKFGVDQLLAAPTLLLLLVATAIFAFGLRHTLRSRAFPRAALVVVILSLLTYAVVGSPEIGYFLQAHRPWAGLLLGAVVAAAATVLIRSSRVGACLLSHHVAAMSVGGAAALVWVAGLMSVVIG